MHEHQLEVTVDVVRRLISDQFPDWARLPLTPVPTEGTVNAIFRIGDGLAARFPLQPGDIDETRRWLRSEADAALELLDHTTFAVPVPVAIGEPGAGYPLPWSVQTWLPGTTASRQDPSSSDAFAHDLARFIHEVRAIDLRGRSFVGGGRGGDLWAHDEWMAVCFQQSEGLLDVPRLRRIWARLRDLPRESPDLMTHGDLIPGNVLVESGRLVGILDVGGLGPADPTIDLVGAWHLLDTGRRELLRGDLGSDDLEWERGKAWAFVQAMGLVWYYESTNQRMSHMGRRTIERILADEARFGREAR
jgi:aminoglycoside phosphotransferase (APT) family kinase protein